ncbi:MAG TPA: hypothetical protein VGV93_14305 [Acidimicrobiales bacterium]|nr:hypothetical protein [Acidimicrobiales bacterium]
MRRIQELTAEGLNLAGVKRVLRLEGELSRLQAELVKTQKEAAVAGERTHQRYRRELVPLSQPVEVSTRDQ